MKAAFGEGSLAQRTVIHLSIFDGTGQLSKRFLGGPRSPREAPVRTRKPSGLLTPSGVLGLVGHAAMGVAMGLAFALILIVMDPSGIATLVDHSGSQGLMVFVGSLVLTFAIGTTLTGAVFIMMEDN
jgi:hypothetical protein